MRPEFKNLRIKQLEGAWPPLAWDKGLAASAEGLAPCDPWGDTGITLRQWRHRQQPARTVPNLANL